MDGQLDSTEGSPETKTLQRMKSKAESARLARRRKKEYVERLEKEVESLRAQIQSQNHGEHVKQKQEKAEHLSQMKALLRRNSVERLVPEVNNVVEKFVAAKRQRQDLMDEYLVLLEDMLEPGMPLQIAFSDQQDLDGQSNIKAEGDTEVETDAGDAIKAEAGDDADEGQSPPPQKRQKLDSVGAVLLETLSEELGLTPLQLESIKLNKGLIKQDREVLVSCQGLIKELRQRLLEHVTASRLITDGLRCILTPVQVAKFLAWVEKNQGRMERLNAAESSLEDF